MKYLTDELIKPGNNLDFVSRLGVLPLPDKVLKRSRNHYQTLRELKNDTHVWSCVQSRKSGTLNLDNFIESNNSSTEIVEFVKDLLQNLDIHRIINELLDAPLMGFHVHEIMWEKSVGSNKFYPTDLLSKPQEFFLIDGFGNVKFKPDLMSEPIKLPDYKFILSTYESTQIQPFGSSLLAKCYWHVNFKNSASRFWVNYMEKYGMPLLVGQYQRGSTQQESQKLAEALAEMTEDTVIVTPMDINIDIKEASRNSSSELFRELIKYCNGEISKTLLSETLTTEMEGGSFAAAQTHFRVRREVIISDSKIAESAINKLIGYAVKINFGNIKAPKFRFVINDSDNLNKIDRDIKLVNAGVKFSKEYWMKTYGLDDVDFLSV